MDKNVLKKFAIESRKELMDKIRNKVNSFYVDENFKSEQKGDIYILSNENHSLSLTNDEFKKRELLIKRINDLSREQVVEEAAYTWFNRIIAIRYMEINDILPLTKDNQSLGIRVLSSKDNIPDPEILKFTNLTNPELDIDFKKEKYAELKDENDKFKYVLLLVCKKLGKVIPQVFDGITDYIDILIPDNLLNDAGFITKVINEVPENNYNQVEIIGWLYQYYNQTEKDRVMSTKKAYKKNEIPYATQLFTPDWIVKYMVENSLGKYWTEHNGDGILYPANNLYPSDTLYPSSIIDNWKYFIKDNIEKQEKKINPTEITFIDPCCGSGHILVYAFEVFYQIYLSAGYNKNEIPELILKNNLYGLDIDDRAGQLSILSVLLKAREYDKNIFNKNIVRKLNIMSIQESNSISNAILDNIYNDIQKDNARYLLDTFKNAKEIGSLLIIEKRDYSELENIVKEDNTIFGIEMGDKLLPLIRIANILSTKYSILVTNPPYMNSSSMSLNLKSYLSKKYKNSKTDLCTAFMETNFVNNNGYYSIINQHSWMFLNSYIDLRKNIVKNYYLCSMIHLGTRAFEEIGGEVVQTTAFVMKKTKCEKNGIYIRLVDFENAILKEKKYLEILNDNNSQFKYYKKANDYTNIPGSPIAYWATKNIIDIYNKGTALGTIAAPRKGNSTSDNNRFLRRWYEIDTNKLNLHAKKIDINESKVKRWYPYNKGGGYKKWYGFNEYVIDWYNDAQEIRKIKSAVIANYQYFMKPGLTWSTVTSRNFSIRWFDEGFIFDNGGCCIFELGENRHYLAGLLNSSVFKFIFGKLNPTLNFQSGEVAKFPVILQENKNINDIIIKKVNENVNIAKEDWNSFETSWDFTKHPFLKSMSKTSTIRGSLANWNTYTYQQRSLLKHNEEELNKIFIDIYGLNDELTPEVDEKDITIRNEDKERDIKSFISYAVGCMFGRYSLDKDGLIYAGGDFDNIYQKYKKADGGWAGSSLSNYKYLNDNGNEIELSFEVDNDNIIPITDEAYFSDDIVERFKTFIKTVYGDNTFNENMDFIAEALGKKGTETSEETIRRYFVNDFFNDHVKMYQKRPIYWLLDSGKKNGFKALIYMHRYNENLIPKARLDYLHRVQTTYEKLLSDVNYRLTTELSMIDKKEAKNRQADLNAKLNEIKEYDEKIAHIANQRISIDLDDGVKVNYEKFKDILAKIK